MRGDFVMDAEASLDPSPVCLDVFVYGVEVTWLRQPAKFGRLLTIVDGTDVRFSP